MKSVFYSSFPYFVSLVYYLKNIFLLRELQALLTVGRATSSCQRRERILFFCLLRELQTLLIVGTSYKLAPAEGKNIVFLFVKGATSSAYSRLSYKLVPAEKSETTQNLKFRTQN